MYVHDLYMIVQLHIVWNNVFMLVKENLHICRYSVDAAVTNVYIHNMYTVRSNFTIDKTHIHCTSS